MNTDLAFEFWRYVPILVAAPAQTLFVLIYSLKIFGAGEWWKDYIGRALFVKSITLALLIDAASFAYFVKFFDGIYTDITFDVSRYWISLETPIIIGYWLVAFGVYYQLLALIRQRVASRMSRDAS